MLKLMIVCLSGCGARRKNIESVFELRDIMPEVFPQPTLYAVAYNGIANFFADRKTCLQLARSHVGERQPRSGDSFSLPVYILKVAILLDAVTFLHASSG